MWVKFRGHLFNFSHICGISADGPIKQSTAMGSTNVYYVRIYSSGKCFEVFTFSKEHDRDICFAELEQIVVKQNQGTQLNFDFIKKG
jgi:hypothetical protein